MPEQRTQQAAYPQIVTGLEGAVLPSPTSSIHYITGPHVPPHGGLSPAPGCQILNLPVTPMEADIEKRLLGPNGETSALPNGLGLKIQIGKATHPENARVFVIEVEKEKSIKLSNFQSGDGSTLSGITDITPIFSRSRVDGFYEAHRVEGNDGKHKIILLLQGGGAATLEVDGRSEKLEARTVVTAQKPERLPQPQPPKAENHPPIKGGGAPKAESTEEKLAAALKRLNDFDAKFEKLSADLESMKSELQNEKTMRERAEAAERRSIALALESNGFERSKFYKNDFCFFLHTKSEGVNDTSHFYLRQKSDKSWEFCVTPCNPDKFAVETGDWQTFDRNWRSAQVDPFPNGQRSKERITLEKYLTDRKFKLPLERGDAIRIVLAPTPESEK